MIQMAKLHATSAGWCCGIVVAAFLSSAAATGLVDFSDNLIAFVEKRWGKEGSARLLVWQRLERDAKGQPSAGAKATAALKLVNGFFNQVPYITDIKHWGVDDYWATPVEMLGSFGGDCEDYSIGKYLSLKETGVPVERLRITYVRALRLGEAHMVLAYYETPDADPLILDNMQGDIRPASQRTDLEPVYGFNDDDLWVVGGSKSKGGGTTVRKWRDLLAKLAKEQAL
jgi:predicted transglutaminase-like cysteine proteinase